VTQLAGGQQLALVDHHVHGIISAGLDDGVIESLLTESSAPPPPGTTAFDSQLGFAVRRWCAPLLDLDRFAPAEAYLRRRAELGAAEAARRLLTGAQVDAWLVDTGYHSETVTSPGELAAISGSAAFEVARLESIAERVARSGGSAAGFAADLAAAVHDAAASAVGFKSVAAYRYGLALAPARPRPAEVAAAAGAWLREISAGAPARTTDQVIIRHGIWTALDTGRPVQVPCRVRRHRLPAARRRSGPAAGLPRRQPAHRHAGHAAALLPLPPAGRGHGQPVPARVPGCRRGT
jgi:uncharacterized protein